MSDAALCDALCAELARVCVCARARMLPLLTRVALRHLGFTKDVSTWIAQSHEHIACCHVDYVLNANLL